MLIRHKKPLYENANSILYFKAIEAKPHITYKKGNLILLAQNISRLESLYAHPEHRLK
jgi:hypothetical protein